MSDDPFAPAGPSWRDRSHDRARKRGIPKEVLAIVSAIGAVVLLLVLWLLLSPSPEEQLESRAREFAEGWTDSPYEVFTRTWLDPNMTAGRKQQLRSIFARRGWLAKRPTVSLVLTATSDSRETGRSEYVIDGFPEDRRLKVYWLRVQREWYMGNIRIPTEEE